VNYFTRLSERLKYSFGTIAGDSATEGRRSFNRLREE